MPACNIVQIACASSNERLWAVDSDGDLKLCNKGQLFVCHGKELTQEYGCIIQHLQSGAYVQQGSERFLRLTYDTASATEFTKLRADFPGKPWFDWQNRTCQGLAVSVATMQCAPKRVCWGTLHALGVLLYGSDILFCRTNRGCYRPGPGHSVSASVHGRPCLSR